MTEKEYLQLAAKAAGLNIDWERQRGPYYAIRGTDKVWHAGLSDYQAFRLANKLHLMVDMNTTRCRVLHYPEPIVSLEMPYPSQDENDRMHINRLCIVRAAAEIQLARERAGKGVP